MLALFPDLPYYFRRHTEDTPNVEALIYIDNMSSDDISVAFRGKINHVMSMFYAVGWEGINGQINGVVSQYYLDHQTEPEDEKVNMEKTDFESMIGYRRLKNVILVKYVLFVMMKLRKRNKEFLRLIVVEMYFTRVACENGLLNHAFNQHALLVEITCVKHKSFYE